MSFFPDPIVTEVNFKDLLFWVENPRITSWSIPRQSELDENEVALKHTDILRYLTVGEGKKKFDVTELARKIKNDGLLDPLIVNQVGSDYLVFEGNRRLAALTLVYQDYMNNNNGIIPARFQKIRCSVYKNLSEDDMFRFVNEWHIEGKLKWTPYCIAYSYKQRYDKGKTIDEITGGVHQRKTQVGQYISAINKMHAYNQHGKETLFSHFLELSKFENKTNKLEACKVSRESFEWKDFERRYVQSAVSKDKGTEAKDMRDVFNKLVEKKTGRTQIHKFSENGDFSRLKSYYETSKLSTSGDKLQKIFNDLKNNKPEITKSLSKNEDRVDYYLGRIERLVKQIINSNNKNKSKVSGKT